MPKEAFEVIVGVSDSFDKQSAISYASQYLAASDTTKTFGQRGDVFDVNVYGEEDGPFGIGLCFAAPIENDDALKRFMDEMTQLAHVESVERVSFEVME